MSKLYCLLLVCSLTYFSLTPKAPRVTIIIVIDQFSSHYLIKLRPFLKGGIGHLAKEGVQFVNAFYDDAITSTAPDHYLLSTGTYGSVHGIVSNKWLDKDGNIVACDDDTPTKSAVFKPTGGLYNYGKSAHQCLVDTLSDQLMLYSYPHAKNKVWSVSIKSRAAIAMAGRLGKALWLDNNTKQYTSSKAYFHKLPSWLNAFNKQIGKSPCAVTWNLSYPGASPAYAFKFAKNYTHSYFPSPYIGKSICYKGKKNHEIYYATPFGNKDLFDLASTVFDNNYSAKSPDRFILWIGLSGLDKVGHIFGPQSKEALDMVYHMDDQLKTFMDKIYQKVPAQDVLFVLTADHGVTEQLDLIKNFGGSENHGLGNQEFELVHHYVGKNLVKALNSKIYKEYGIKDFIIKLKEPQLYVNQKILANLPNSKKQRIYQSVKDYLLALPGVRRAWTFDELQNTIFPPYDLDGYLPRQLYKGRSGQLFFSTNPYTMINKHQRGTSHISGYAYDTQVPLIFYQKNRFIKKRISTNVYIPQVSVTLATLLEVPRPSAAVASVLPELKI